MDWHEELAGAEPVDPVPVAATDPLYVLYTSGTTGKPKGIVRDNGGHAVALLWTMQHIYDIGAGEVFWAASDVGWVVGHSYIVYAPLLAGATTVLYEGKPVGTPDPGAFWRVISEHQVKALFTAPTAIRAIRKEDPEATYVSEYDLASLRYLFLAGERLDPDTYHWASDELGIPVIDHWWQTETGWPIAANPSASSSCQRSRGRRPSPCLATGSMLGPVGTCARGERRSRSPSAAAPAGQLAHPVERRRPVHRVVPVGFSRYYLTGDGGYLDEDGYLFVMGASTTSSTSPGTACRPGPSKRCWPRIPPSRSARSSASPTRSRVRYRADS